MCLYPQFINVVKDGHRQFIRVACGKCLECELNKSREWAFRIVLEALAYPCNCFLTLTYNDDNLPLSGSVSRKEVTLFIKRLRSYLSPARIRFFSCGEYGKKNLRPHYHIVIFNWFPDDCFFLKKEGKTILYRSPTVEKLWTKGFSSVGELSFHSALYCAKYLNKYNYDHLLCRDPRYKLLERPFIQMSNRPGIGYNYIHLCDLHTDKIYYRGQSIKIPRYFLKVLEREGYFLGYLKENRIVRSHMCACSQDLEDRRRKFFNKYLT